MNTGKHLPNLTGYPARLIEQVQQLIAQDKLAELLRNKYSDAHAMRTDQALYDYLLV